MLQKVLSIERRNLRWRNIVRSCMQWQFWKESLKVEWESVCKMTACSLVLWQRGARLVAHCPLYYHIVWLDSCKRKTCPKTKDLFMTFVNLKEAFDRVRLEVVWWALRFLSVDEWIVFVIEAMHENALTKMRVNERQTEGDWCVQC